MPRRVDDNGFAQLSAMMHANDIMEIAGTEKRLERLARRLNKFDRTYVLRALGGLLTEVSLHPTTVRIEMLSHLAALRCDGRQIPEAAQIREWLNDILAGDAVGRSEDPTEDVFLANVISSQGNTRVFEGIWEYNAAYLQACMYALTQCACEGVEWAEHALRQAHALLALSEAVADRACLPRNTASKGRPWRRIQFPSAKLEELGARVSFTEEELYAIGVHPFDLQAFNIAYADASTLRNETIGWTSFERRPVLLKDGNAILALPTAVGAAIRRRCIEQVLDHGTQSFVRHLSDHQFGLVTTSLIGWRIERIAPISYDEATGLGQIKGRFDEGGYAHIIFVQDRLEDIAEGGFTSINDVSDSVSDLALAEANAIAGQPDYQRGLTIIVFGGLGRSFTAGFKEMPKGWQLTSLSVDDFGLLGWDSDSSALQVCRLLEQEDQLRQAGNEIMNINGLMNLYGFAKSVDYMLLPPDAGYGNTLIPIASNFLSSVRQRVRYVLDRHAVRAPDGLRYYEVQRSTTGAFFESVLSEPLFVSIAHASQGELLCCVEASRPWWLSAVAPKGDHRSLVYRVWDMLRNWLVHAVPAIEERFGDGPDTAVLVTLRFPELSDLTEDFMLEEGATTKPVVLIDGNTITIDCPNLYIRTFARPKNDGDRLLVEAVIRGAAALTGEDVSDADIEAMAQEIVPANGGRYLHVFPARTPADAALSVVGASEPRLVQPEVLGWVNIGLGAAIGRKPGLYEGKNALSGAWAAVDALWGMTRERLLTLDRESVIARCLHNHDAIDMERRTWRNTAGPVMELHGSKDDPVGTALRRESARAQASLTVRAVAEMAVCTAPLTGGRACSNYDLDYMVACVSLLIEIANHRDAMYYGFSPQRLDIRPNGSFAFDTRFLANIQQPYMTAHGRDQFLAAAGAYDGLYDRPTDLGDDEYEAASNNEYDAAFVAENGLTPLQFVDFLWQLTQHAAAEKSSVFRSNRSELVAMLKTVGVGQAAAGVAIDHLLLKPRAKWDERKPEGARDKDWYPWRFSRRLSLLAKPIIQLSTDDNPVCLVSAPLVEHGFDYAMRALKALLPPDYFHSDEMGRWIGKVVDELGHAFNRRVASVVAAEGLEAESDYKMTQLGFGNADGDVDVLAWDKPSGRVFIMECKRLLMDRTVGEIADRLKEYAPDYVDANGRRGPTRKHLARLAKLQATGRVALAKVTGIDAGRMILHSCLVTEDIVPMQFHASDHFDMVTTLDGLPDALKSFKCEPA